MILTDNKRHGIDNRVFYGIYWREVDIDKTNWRIKTTQNIRVNILISSEYLLRNLYNDIRR